MVHFTDLPWELLRLIVVNLDRSSLKSLSLVNQKCRAASISDIFHTIKLVFSKYGFEALEELSRSSLSSSVKALHYEVPELIDPFIQHWDYFTTCIYTPQEYARDQMDFHWNLRGKEFSYKAIYDCFRTLARGQGVVLKERSDIRIFLDCLSHLSNLRTIKLSVTRAQEDRLLWFAHRLFLDSGNSSLIHLEPVLRGMVVAQDNGIFVESIEIHGMQLSPTTTDNNMLEVAEVAMKYVKNFKLVDSPGLLEFMSSVPLPCLRQFKLADCWFRGLDLIRFLDCHDVIVQRARFHRVGLFYEIFKETRGYSECLKEFWEAVSGSYVRLTDLVLIGGP